MKQRTQPAYKPLRSPKSVYVLIGRGGPEWITTKRPTAAQARNAWGGLVVRYDRAEIKSARPRSRK
jgi:hypothetical protein